MKEEISTMKMIIFTLLQKSQKLRRKRNPLLTTTHCTKCVPKKVNHNANIEERDKSLRRNHRIATTQTSYHRAKVAIAKLSEFKKKQIKSNCKV